MNNGFSELMYVLGFISLILAPFTGVSLITAACFFVIGRITDTSPE